ncbi:MAG: 3-methyl-2-oxobutanoate dehydrogenase subunit VorB [Candidatus Gygaella obscura]|nr:3-methyl-2-oxobutanoate dehydrogenase subunit VorB [Candidatus Gygaella obscura]
MKTQKKLSSGNEAVVQAAIYAECKFYAGYPITPQNEIPALMSKRIGLIGGVFIQAESELAAINMVFGASAAGARAMTTSSSPGISLKQEGISYIAGAQLPAVIVNMVRGGPGLGNIAPSQSDYFQATKGGGHGDYHLIVLSPASIQETFHLTVEAFDLADKYRNPVMILGDGLLAQMIEQIILPKQKIKIPVRKKTWALTGAKNRDPNIIRTLFLKEGALEEHNLVLQEKYKLIGKNEIRFEEYLTKDADILLVAYGTMARIVKGAVDSLRAQGIKAGLFRPISLWPFPYAVLKTLSKNKEKLLVVEMSYGQMVEDVRLSVEGSVKVDFFGRAGGGVPKEEAIIKKVKAL